MPSPAMRAAMAEAELGDDVYSEDPTVNRLEALAAQKVGHEATLLVPSGTMGNLIAPLTHSTRGQRVIAGSEYHIYQPLGTGHIFVSSPTKSERLECQRHSVRQDVRTRLALFYETKRIV